MGRPLGSLLAAVLLLGGVLSACGQEQDGTVSDEPAAGASPTSPSPTSPGSTSPGPGEPVDAELVRTITATGGGGGLSQSAVPLGDEEAAQEFVDQFASESFKTDVVEAARSADVPDDQLLYGAVVAIGCDVPDKVQVFSTETGLRVVAQPVDSPKPECLEAMTTVALVLVPTPAVG